MPISTKHPYFGDNGVNIDFLAPDDAQKVYEALLSVFAMDGYVGVDVLFDLSGVKKTYTDMFYGWRGLGEVTVINTDETSTLTLPRPVVIWSEVNDHGVTVNPA